MGGNEIGGATRTEAALAAGKQQFTGRGSTGWSALTEAVKMFGPAATTQDFSKKILRWQADFMGEWTKCATFKIKAVEATNLRVFVGMINGDVELKIFHSMLKYNDLFVPKNILENVIAFMGYFPL